MTMQLLDKRLSSSAAKMFENRITKLLNLKKKTKAAYQHTDYTTQVIWSELHIQDLEVCSSDSSYAHTFFTD